MGKLEWTALLGPEIDVWAGSHGAVQNSEPITTASTKLYLASLHSSAITKIEVNPEAREQMVWHKFQLSEILKSESLTTAAQVQDAIFLSVTKAVLRFPGLRKSDKVLAFTVSNHPDLSERPCDTFDNPTKAPLPITRYQEPLKVINHGVSYVNGVYKPSVLGDCTHTLAPPK